MTPILEGVLAGSKGHQTNSLLEKYRTS